MMDADERKILMDLIDVVSDLTKRVSVLERDPCESGHNWATQRDDCGDYSECRTCGETAAA